MAKQLMLALGAGGAATAAIVASAATLGTVDSTDLGASSTAIVSCDNDTTDSITVDYTTTFAAGEYDVTTVTLGDLDAACIGQAAKITLYDTNGDALGTASGNVSTASQGFVVTGTAAAEDVEGVAVVISG